MFKENIMKKIAGLSVAAIVMMPGVVNAATYTANPFATSADKTVCTIDATTSAEAVKQLEDCVSGSDNVAITVTGSAAVAEDFSKVKKVVFSSADITIDSSFKKAINNIELVTDGDLIVTDKATLNLTGSSKITGTGEVKVTDATLNISSNGTVAIDTGVNTTVTDGTLKVANGSIEALTIEGTSTVDVKKVKGAVTIDGTGKTILNASELASTLAVNGTKEVTVTVPGEIAGVPTVSNPKADVRIAAANVTPSVTAGIVRKADNDGTVKVLVKGVNAVELGANDVLVIDNSNKAEAKNLTVTGNGKIDNQTGEEITIKSINGASKVVIGKDYIGDNAYVVGNGNQTPANPEEPGQTTQTPDGDVTVGKNPATGDSIMSYVTLALTSVASLGLAVKKFLF